LSRLGVIGKGAIMQSAMIKLVLLSAFFIQGPVVGVFEANQTPTPSPGPTDPLPKPTPPSPGPPEPKLPHHMLLSS
jgi:hypothetical protein